MKRFLIILLFLPGTLPGQDSTFSNFRLGLNTFIFQNKEPLMNGQSNSCLGFTTQLGWEKITHDKTHFLSLVLGMARPKSELEPVNFSIWANIELRYDYLRKIKQSTFSVLYAGGLASVHYRLGYYPLWDDSHPYWATSISAGPALRYEKKLHPANIYFVAFELPLIGLVSRPPLQRQYKIDNPEFGNLISLNHKEIEFATINRYAELELRTGFYLIYSAKYANEFFLFFNYLSLNTSYSEPYREIQIGAGISFIL